MLKFRLAAAAAIACAITLLSSGAAQAYPDCGIALSVDNATLVGGETFTFTADAPEIDCDWTAKYAGETKTGNGTSISGSFSTEAVDKRTTTRIYSACEHAVVSSGSSAEAAKTQTCSVSANVTLLPQGDNSVLPDGVLPDTGGSNLWILVLGGALVVGGAGLTYVARRRNTSR